MLSAPRGRWGGGGGGGGVAKAQIFNLARAFAALPYVFNPSCHLKAGKSDGGAEFELGGSELTGKERKSCQIVRNLLDFVARMDSAQRLTAQILPRKKNSFSAGRPRFTGNARARGRSAALAPGRRSR